MESSTATADPQQQQAECSACSGHGPFSRRQLKKAAAGELASECNQLGSPKPAVLCIELLAPEGRNDNVMRADAQCSDVDASL